MRALIAFDKFKDALTARQACEAAATALRAIHPDWELDLCPLADGGDGFLDVLTCAAGGQTRAYPVMGPRGSPIKAAIGFVPVERIPPGAFALLGLASGLFNEGSPRLAAPSGAATTIAVIEMAAASGLALVPRELRDPWLATSYGTGELIRAAAKHGASAVLLGVGGSATNDLGLGALAALGLEFRTGGGLLVDVPVPALWREVEAIGGAVAPPLPPIRIACDVDNPLLGPRGATATYGPQKGLAPGDFDRMEAAMARAAGQLESACNPCSEKRTGEVGRTPGVRGGGEKITGAPAGTDTPGSGAAGGITFGLMVAAGARLVPGFSLVSAWLDIERRISEADLVITGEGSFDQSSSHGKGPGALIDLARRLGKPAHVFAGRISAAPIEGVALNPITPEGMPLAEALAKASLFLSAAVGKNLSGAPKAASHPPSPPKSSGHRGQTAAAGR